jgi:serine/threonine protein kinase
MDAWLLDWGLSTPLPVERQRLGISIGRRSVGTPDYMSPEAIEGFEDVDHRSDIYSLGLTLYEWSVGKSARASETTDVHAFFAELVDANFAIDLSPVPAPLRRIVRLATAPARRERYQSWSVMIADCLPLVG